MKKSELREIIREVVKEEIREHMAQVKKYVKTTVPIIIGESVAAYVDDKLEEASPPPKSKKRSINEAVADEDWPMLDKKILDVEDRPRLGNRSRLAEMLGYGDTKPTNLVTSVVTESGVEVPINPNQVPDHLVKALNKDYSGYMKKLNDVTANVRSKGGR